MSNTSRVRSTVASLSTLAGGGLLAVVPATVLVISGKLYSLEQQGFIAVAVTVSLFVGQLASAAIVESRLSSRESSRRVNHPKWLLILVVIAALSITISGGNVVMVCIGLPFLLASLEVGRGVSIAEQLNGRELAASIAVGLGALSGIVLAFIDEHWALTPLVLAIVIATLLRSWRLDIESGAISRKNLRWILIDVSFVGVIFPIVNLLILARLGGSESFVFASISTISGLIGIPLSYLRMRLLKEHSPFDILLSASTAVLAIVSIFVADALGVFGLLFGSAWETSSTFFALALACGWRTASLWSTIPFARLRRMGQVKRLTLLRTSAVVATFTLALIAVQLGSVALVFGALLLGELLQALLYEMNHRKLRLTDAGGTSTGGKREDNPR